MSLIDKFARECELLEFVEHPDGQGGTVTDWMPKARFPAAFVKKNSGTGTTAEKSVNSEQYTVTVPGRPGLKYNDVIRRVCDGLILRVTSDSADTSPPACATFMFEQVNAERWELP